MRVLVTGATGLIGRALVLRLRRDGHTVLAWVRSMARGRTLLGTEAELVDATGGTTALQATLSSCDAVVNLAGASVADGRWTAKRKQEILQSRLQITSDIVAALKGISARPRVLINASAVGYYGVVPGRSVDEAAPAGSDFLAQVCQQWEQAAEGAQALGVRVVRLRLGVVLGHEGGVLHKLVPLFDRGVGSVLGDGKQAMPWVHLHDVANAVAFALTHTNLTGAVNVVAPEETDNAMFTAALARRRGSRPFVPVPRAALRLALGEAATMALSDQRVVPRALLESGFRFVYPQLDTALDHLFQPQTVTIEPCSAQTQAPVQVPGENYLRLRRPTMLLRAQEVVAYPVSTVFEFFCRPENLGLLTPIDMALQSTGELPAVMQSGAIIDYTLKVAGVPLRWRTRIAAWNAPELFVDTQDRGPYRAWWHEHHFYADGQQTRMEDRVYYAVGKGPVGSLAHAAGVKLQLERIFRHRASAIGLRFGAF